MARLQLENISKSFPGVKALEDVSLTVDVGEIHALCGENGAGKSTLMNIITGNLQPDKGTIMLNEQPVTFANAKAAFDKGIAIVHQHLSLVDNLSIAENIFANQHPVNRLGLIDYKKLYRITEDLLRELNISLDPRTLVANLSPAEKQLTEIAKALSKKPQVLILDEPTASLTDSETKTLFNIIHTRKSEGCSILYISHRLPEIFELADKVSILKDGKFQGTSPIDSMSRDLLIKTMVGREVIAFEKKTYSRGEKLLSVKNLAGDKFRDISFELYEGEILGFAGLVGAGRTEIARAIFGADEKYNGNVYFKGTELIINDTADALKHHIGYVPEERKSLGLFMDMSIKKNVIAAALEKKNNTDLLNETTANQKAELLKTQLRIVANTIQQPVATLSGGNQQKVVLAKWLSTAPEVLMVDEPTHGVDVGAKNEIYIILKKLADQGKGIIVISSELPELLAICDRILIIRHGQISGELMASEATEEKILALAM